MKSPPVSVGSLRGTPSRIGLRSWHVSRHTKRKRRRRARGGAPGVPPRTPRAQRIDERPKAPWHPVPLVELAVLVGIVCIALGFFHRDTQAGRATIALGVTLGALGGLDTTIREHFAGFRSHSALLGLILGAVTAVVLVVVDAPRALQVGLAVAVFLVGFYLMRRTFKTKTGGMGFRA